MMSPTAYTVHISGAVADQFRDASRRAVAEDRVALFVAAANWAVTELERTPSEFGESREVLPVSGLRVRCGFAGPVYVEFGILELKRQVFLRKFRLVR